MKFYKHFQEHDAIKYLIQILNAFKTFHEFQIVHRDIKLENIFIKDGVLKVGDLGFAKEG